MKLFKRILIALVLVFGFVAIASCEQIPSQVSEELQAKVTELEEKVTELEGKDYVSELTTSLQAASEEIEALKAQVAELVANQEKEGAQQAETKDAVIAICQTALEALGEEQGAEFEKIIDVVNHQFSLKVVDLDGEVLFNQKLSTDVYTSLWDALDQNCDVVATVSEYGHYISEINDSVVDANWYLELFENGESSLVGVDGVTVDAGDKFEFINNCWNTKASGWGTMDEYDVAVDVTIYHYLKTYGKQALEGAGAYTGSNYWEHCAYYMMNQLGYDKTDAIVSEALSNSLNLDEEAMGKVSANNIMKYFYAARFAGLLENNTLFKNRCETLFETNVTEWQIAVAQYYGVTMENEKLAKVVNAATYNTSWGTDTAVWSYCLRALYRDNTLDVEPTTMSLFQNTVSYANGCSQALILLAYAKDNVSARSFKADVTVGEETVQKDVLEMLFDLYYDEELHLVKWKTTDASTNMSTNQIYAGLMAYKAQRDTGKAINIFAPSFN